MDKFIDYFLVIITMLLCCFLGVSLLIETSNKSKIEDEKKCVDFYKNNNGYILDSCSIYKDKLQNIN